MKKSQKYILWFREISSKDIPLVGGKNASLGEMIARLSKKGINIPDGFCLTSRAYWYFLKANKIDKKLKEIFKKFNPKSLKSLQQTGRAARILVLKAEFPEDLKREIERAYKKLSKKYQEENADVAVRSSGVCEDAPEASFAGQFETFLNIKGKDKLLIAVKKCLASTFNNRVIAYREEKGFPQLKFALSVGIQKMARSDLASSGVIFTLDTETGFRKVVLINSIYGVGEMIVKGKITPDEFYVFKPTLKQGYRSIILKNLGRKTRKYIYHKKGGLKEVNVPSSRQLKFSLSDDEILTLAHWGSAIEELYKIPQDIEWAKDGKTGELFITQSRPETVHALKKSRVFEEYQIRTKKQPILRGTAIGDKIGFGKVHLIADVSKIDRFKKGEVLVTEMTDPDWVSAFPLASAIITDEGGKTCFSGDTLLITNKGFLPIKEIIKRYKHEKIYTLSLNKEILELEWQRIIDGMERKAKTISVNISQTGKIKNNQLKVTPDHKFYTFDKRKLILKEIQEIISKKEGIITPYKIPSFGTSETSSKIAYLLGVLSTDGHIVYKRYGKKLSTQIFFIQQPTKAKKEFIERVNKYFQDGYGYSLHILRKPPSGGIIRGREIKGKGAIVLKCYKKEIVEDILKKQKSLPLLILGASKETILNFLAGVIDGDGSFRGASKKFRTPPRVHIYCSNSTLFQAIVIGCLRLGINFQVSPNRNILNIQLVDNFQEVLKYTARIKLEKTPSLKEKRYFFAKQLLEDIKYRVNYEGKILTYITNNLIISTQVIQNYIFPKIQGTIYNHQLSKILDSPLKMFRVRKLKRGSEQRVYNITVEGNHNYVVFSKYLTPIIVSNCHAAIVSRELGIPAIVGTQKATKILKTGQQVTVDCTQGLNGRIFTGKVPFKIKRYDLKKIPKLRTKIMINIGAPEIAFKTSFLPNDGVGLAREEFIIAEKIRVHPLALYHYEKLKNRSIKKKIEAITVEHKDKKEYFVKELAEGIGQIAAAFYPKPVIVRFSDFKTNEYRQLIGGELFEPKDEANPMLGWRGASRYYDEKFKPAFLMECQAIKRVRDVFGLKNVKVMIPFCRTIEEGKRVLAIMKKAGLERGKDDLEVYVMCEVPSNVILAEEFLKIFDGMSIGSNDLTQLTLGIDRDAATLQKIGDERNPAVKKMISKIIRLCKMKKKYCGICGDAPSSLPDFAEFLMDCKIPSISLSPDAVIKTILILAKTKK